MKKRVFDSYICGLYDLFNNEYYFSVFDVVKCFSDEEPYKLIKEIKSNLKIKFMKRKICTDNRVRYISVVSLNDVVRIIFYINSDRAVYVREFFLDLLKSKLFHLVGRKMFVSVYDGKRK